MADCLACARPQPDTAYVCSSCASRLEERMHTAASLVPELETAVAKLARFGEPGPRSRGRAPAAPIRPDGGTMRHYADQDIGTVTGLPYDWAASDARDAVTNTVSTWCRAVHDERAQLFPGELGAAMRWLAGQLEWLRHQKFAGEAFDELGDAARLVSRAVDRPAERVDAGVCLAVLDSGEKCQRRLSAPRAAARVRCPGCGATHDAEKRRETLLAEARSQRGTATEVARWLTLLGLPTPAATVRKWVQRGRLVGDAGGMYAFRDIEQLRMRESRSAA